MEVLLDLCYYITYLYTDPRYYEEMSEFAIGANIDFATIRRIHMIGTLTEAHCSMYGAWGNAT
jgi:hypothetical protein